MSQREELWGGGAGSDEEAPVEIQRVVDHGAAGTSAGHTEDQKLHKNLRFSRCWIHLAGSVGDPPGDDRTFVQAPPSAARSLLMREEEQRSKHSALTPTLRAQQNQTHIGQVRVGWWWLLWDVLVDVPRRLNDPVPAGCRDDR